MSSKATRPFWVKYPLIWKWGGLSPSTRKISCTHAKPFHAHLQIIPKPLLHARCHTCVTSCDPSCAGRHRAGVLETALRET